MDLAGMEVPSPKRLRRSIEPDPSCSHPSRHPTNWHQRLFNELPVTDINTVFVYCDLPTRCKIRRVCRNWECLISRKEVNEVVHVDQRCLWVTCTSLQSIHFQAMELRKNGRPRQGFAFGYYDAREVLLTDHRRHGLLGPHVRVMIYRGTNAYQSAHALPRIIRSIGYFCSGVRHLVLWRAAVLGPHLMKNDFVFQDVTPDAAPVTPQITLVDVVVKLCLVRTPDDAGKDSFQTNSLMDVQRKVAYCTAIPGQLPPDQKYTPVELEWIAKHAQRLPQKYHIWAQARIRLYPLNSGALEATARLPKLKLVIGRERCYPDTTCQDLLRVLANCIVKERLSGIEPVPATFLC